MDYPLIQFIVGFLSGAFIVGLLVSPTHTQKVMQSIEALTLAVVAVFTAYWTSKTFAHEAKSAEAKEIMEIISRLEKSIHNLVYVSLLESIEKVHSTDTNKEQIARYQQEFEVASNIYLQSISNQFYVSPSALAACLLAYPPINSKELIQDRDKRDEAIKKLWEAKNEIRKTTYFNLTAEWRRLRNYLRF